MTAAGPTPCPVCGTETVADATRCGICGCALHELAPSNAGTGKCARCGSGIPAACDFCPICGQDQRRRFARPVTAILAVDPVPASDGSEAARTGPESAREVPSEPVPVEESPPTPRVPPRATPRSASGGAPGGAAEPPSAATPSPLPAPRGRNTIQVQEPPEPRPPLPDPPEPSALGEAVVARPARAEAPSHLAEPPLSDRAQLVVRSPFPMSKVAPPSQTPTAPGLQPIRLVLVEDDGREHRSVPLVGPSLVLGRSDGDLCFEHDTFLSPTHARLERRADKLVLVDLGSQNGVYLRLRESRRLEIGSMFLFGQQLFRFESCEAQSIPRAPAGDGTRWFGTPLPPPWGRLVRMERDADTNETFYLRRSLVTFGRESGDFVFPDDPFVSREHARLRLVAADRTMHAVLEDLGSANGTYIRVHAECEVEPGDTFRIGDQILRLRGDA